MSSEVYANGDEIACKAGNGKVMAAFPDVCLSPPSPPAGPVPVPYPNTSFSKDLQQGSKTVKLGGQPAALAQQSYYKTSPLGDEAATRSFGASVITHQITGKTYFQAWSMDVVIEGKNACRHFDLTTSNHASYPGSTPPFPNMEKEVAMAQERIAEGECPCCGKKDCPAAFQKDDVAQSMEDFYGLAGDTDEAKDRMKVYQMMLGMKEKHCTCDGQVFPKAPCDVFRAPNAERTRKIEEKWTGQSDVYYSNFTSANPDALTAFVARNPAEPAPSGGPRFSKVDHLTPKGAGGCPDNPNNLQPHDTLCKTCKLIDDQFTEWQGNNPNWRDVWNKAFRESKIKRHTVANFTPGFW
jgi:hypothetical protein